MKKIFLLLLLLILNISYAFSYTPSIKEEIFLDTIYKKLDLIGEKQPLALEKLVNQIKGVKYKFKDNLKVYYILGEIESYTQKFKNVKNTYFVEDVVDGDTIKINFNSEIKTIRLIGVDSPESYDTRFGYKECYGEEAKIYLSDLLKGKNIVLEFDYSQLEKDKYDRLLGYIFLDDENINNNLILNGYAWEYTFNKAYKYQELFMKSEKTAKLEKIGLWNLSSCNGERVEKKEIEAQIEKITDNDTKKIYHTGERGGCYYINDKGNKAYVNHSFCILK